MKGRPRIRPPHPTTLDPAELDHDQDQTSGDSKSPGGQGDVDTPSASDAFNTYVRCENVKP